MADFTVIKASEAPKPIKANNRFAARKTEYDQYISAVRAGGEEAVGKIVLNTSDGNDKYRKVASRLSWAAKRQGVDTETWNDNSVVYFKVIAQTKPVKAREPKASKPKAEATTKQSKTKASKAKETAAEATGSDALAQFEAVADEALSKEPVTA